MALQIDLVTILLTSSTLTLVIYSIWMNHWRGPKIQLELTRIRITGMEGRNIQSYWIDFVATNNGSRAGELDRIMKAEPKIEPNPVVSTVKIEPPRKMGEGNYFTISRNGQIRGNIQVDFTKPGINRDILKEGTIQIKYTVQTRSGYKTNSRAIDVMKAA